MTAQIIQFVPRPAKSRRSPIRLISPSGTREATADWLKQLNEFAGTTPTDPPKDIA